MPSGIGSSLNRALSSIPRPGMSIPRPGMYMMSSGKIDKNKAQKLLLITFLKN